MNKNDYEKLIKEIEYHNDLYYNQDDPEISDYEYDQLTQKLRRIEKEHPEWVTKKSPSQKVGGTVKREAGISVEHKVPMLSLLDVFNLSEVEAFVDKVATTEYTVEHKIDGLSLSAEYTNGKLTRASTRGNGLVGEDVLLNAENIIGLPHKVETDVPFFEVRGEVYMNNKDFEDVNANQEKNNKKTFKNARNCAAGTLRQLQPDVVKERKLRLFVFNIQQIEGKTFDSHYKSLVWLASLGFNVVKAYCCENKSDILNAIKTIGKERSSLPFGIDGAVIKVDSLNYRSELGATSKVPRWAVAYKYKPETKPTKILRIDLQVGRTGRITPVAVFEPTDVAGSTIEKATLHNQDQIKRLNINVGDEVIIQKAGDVIPEIAFVAKKNSEGYFIIPDKCPVCGGQVVDGECTSVTCPAKAQRQIEFFASKECMDIAGMGPSVVSSLIGAGYLGSVVDIFLLKDKRQQLINENIIGREKTVDNLLTAIEKSKDRDMAIVIKAIGIKNIGRHAGKIIEQRYPDIEKLMDADYDTLVSLDGIGDIGANSIIEFFKDENNRKIVTDLKKHGVNITAKENKTKKESPISGKSFVITGTLATMKRSECEQLIQENGGIIKSGISKNTDYLVAGEKAGSKKEKAEKLGVKIISENELIDMLKE